MDKQCIVWVKEADGWRPTTVMTKAEADRLAAELDESGRRFVVVERPRTTVKELIEA